MYTYINGTKSLVGKAPPVLVVLVVFVVFVVLFGCYPPTFLPTGQELLITARGEWENVL